MKASQRAFILANTFVAFLDCLKSQAREDKGKVASAHICDSVVKIAVRHCQEGTRHLNTAKEGTRHKVSQHCQEGTRHLTTAKEGKSRCQDVHQAVQLQGGRWGRQHQHQQQLEAKEGIRAEGRVVTRAQSCV